MKEDGNSLNYIELHYNFLRYKIYGVMIKNYEEFWEWLTVGKSAEFIVISNVLRETRYVRKNITNFYEKQGEEETERSEEAHYFKNRMYRSIGEGTNMSILSGMADINNMQLKLNQESVRNQFKPKMIGGTEMSGQASENTYKVEENSKNDNRDISNEIISIRKRLKEETEEKKRLQADMDEVLKELNSYIAECNNKDLIIKTMGEKQSSQNIKLQNEIHSIEEEKKNTEKQLAEYNIKINKINDYSSGLEETNAKYLKEIENLKKDKEKILQELKEEKEKPSASKDNGFKEDIISIYKKIESLVDEADKYVMTNDELKKKLDDEKQRADKAENNLNEFMKSVSNLKEKFESEQRIVESQFKIVLEKQYNFQAEINNCLANYNK